MSYTDERVVKMTFDHSAFNKDIDNTIKNLKALDSALDLDNAAKEYKVFDNLSKSADGVYDSMTRVESSVGKVEIAFSKLQIAGLKVMWDLMDTAKQLGNSLYNSTIGMITQKGMSRALNLESAKFQLEGMKVSWDGIKGDIDYAVDKTAYGLDAAAKVASQLTASNVKTGDNMKNALRGISGVAAMTNSSYEEIGHIFTTVAANDRLMTENLRQLSVRGLNVAANMVDYFKNVKKMSVETEQDINDMVSKGKIHFQDFANAMDYAFGEHAKEANSTFTGALSNMQSALGRIGELFQTPKIQSLTKVYGDLIPVINTIKAALKPIAELYNTILNLSTAWFATIRTNKDLHQALIKVVVAAWTWMFALYRAAEAAGIRLPNLAKALKSINDAADNLILTGEKYKSVKTILTALFGIVNSFKVVIKSIGYVLEPLFKMIGQALGVTITDADSAAIAFSKMLYIFNAIVTVVAKLLRSGLEKFLEYLPVLAKAAELAFIGLLVAIVAVADKISHAVFVIKEFASSFKMDSVANSVTDATTKFTGFGAVVVSVFSKGMSLAKSFGSTVSNGFKALFDGIFKSSEETKKKTEDISKNLGGAIGGKYLKGKFGMNNGLVDMTKALDHYKKSVEDASEEDKEKSKGFGQGMISALKDNSKKTKEIVEQNPDSIGGAAYDTITDMMPFLKYIADKSTVAGVIDKAFSKFSSLLKGLGDHFSKPMNWLKDGAIAALIVAGVSFMKKIREFIGISKETGDDASSAGSSISGLAKVLWSISGIILALGAVAKFVKAEDFKAVALTIGALVAGLVVVLRSLITLRKVGAMADAVKGLAKSLERAMHAIWTVNGNLKVTIKKITSSMAEILHELVSVIGIFMVSVVTIVVLSKAFDISMDDFITASVLIVGSVLALILGIVIINAILMSQKGSMQKSVAGLQFSRKFFTMETDSAAISLAGILASVTAFMLSFALATAGLAAFKWEKTLASGAILITGTILAMATVLGIMMFATKAIYKQRASMGSIFANPDTVKKDNNETARVIELFMDSFKPLLKAMSNFMTSLALSMKIIMSFGTTSSQMWSAMGTLTLALGAVSGLIIFMYWFANKMAKDFKDTKGSEAILDKMTSLMTKILIRFSLLVLALSVGMAIVGSIDYRNIVPASIAFGIIVTVVAGLMIAIAWGLKQISDSALLLTLNEDQMSTINKTLKTVSVIFAEMIIGIVAIAGTFAVIAKLVENIGDPKVIMMSMSVMLMSIGSVLLMMLALNKLAEKAPDTGSLAKLSLVLGSVLTVITGMALVIKLLSTIDWKSFEGSEKYLIGFGVALMLMVVVFSAMAKLVNNALTGVIGVSVIILAIGTLAIMIGFAASLFADSIIKMKDAFKEMAAIDGDQAKETMGKLKDTVALFTEAMSQGPSVLASAIVFASAMFLMGNGMKALASVDAKTMEQTVKALEVLFKDMDGLIGLAWTGIAFAALFGILGVSLAAGAVGFLVFAAVMGVAIDLVLPLISKFANVLEECQNLFKDFKILLTKDDLDKILVGLAELFLIGAVMGLAAGTLAVSSAVFLVGIGLLYLASKYYSEVMQNFRDALASFSGKELWEMIKDMATLTTLGLIMSLAAGILLGGVIGLLAASAIGLAAAKVLSKFLKALYSAFSQVKAGVIIKGSLELLGASVVLGLAAGVMLLAAIPFMAAMTLFGIGLGMLTINIAILGYGLGLLADALNNLATVDSEKVMDAVDTVVLFVEKLNEALNAAAENFDEETMGGFGDGILALAGKLLLAGVMLPLAGLGLIVGAALLSGAMSVMKDAFEDMNLAYQAMNMETIGALINNLNVFTQSLSEFVVDFMLYDLAFAVGAGLFAAAAWLLNLGLGFMNEATTKYDVKKILSKVKPLTEIGNVFLKFSAQMLGSSVMLTIAGLAISWAVSEVLEQMRQATQDIPPFVETICSAIDQIAAKVDTVAEIGGDIAHGLVTGMTGGANLVFEKGFEIASTLIDYFREGADSHSDSKKTIQIGYDIVHGLLTGMKNEEGEVDKEGESIGKKLISFLADGIDDGKSFIANAGSSIGDLFGLNFESSALGRFTETVTNGKGILGGLASLFGGIDKKRAALQQAVSGLDKSAQAAKQYGGENSSAYKDEYRKLTEAKEALAAYDKEGGLLKGGIEDLMDMLGLKDLFNNPSGVGDTGGGYTPDYTGVDTNTALTDLGKSAGTSNLGSAKSAGSGVNNSITNNTYNFVQNNYSPEPIDRTELYLQTNNQLNTWYKWLRST